LIVDAVNKAAGARCGANDVAHQPKVQRVMVLRAFCSDIEELVEN
jgi:hypothetical protein